MSWGLCVGVRPENSMPGLWLAPLGTYSHELHLRCDFCSCNSNVILGLFCVGSTAHLGCLSEGCDPLCNIQEAIMFSSFICQVQTCCYYEIFYLSVCLRL